MSDQAAEEQREFAEKVAVERQSSRRSGDNRAASAYVWPAPGELSQWSMLGNDTYKATGPTLPAIPPDAYFCAVDGNNQLMFVRASIVTDELTRLPDTASAKVLESISTFWERKESFKAKGQIFKRGILLWGPPGSGKTVTVMLLVQDLIKRGGIVLIVGSPEIAAHGLSQIRKIEPDRPIICVMEDIDEIIEQYSEPLILSLLDGENQVDNVVHLATTNYPELLDARLVNRPSRFDEIIKIGMPSPEARRVYLRARVGEKELTDRELDGWVKDTEGMSIAHLREIVVAVFCLGREYKQTLERLKAMRVKPKSTGDNIPGFK